MSEDRVVELHHPETFSDDTLTAVLRSGARRLLAQAIEIEVSGFLARSYSRTRSMAQRSTRKRS